MTRRVYFSLAALFVFLVIVISFQMVRWGGSQSQAISQNQVNSQFQSLKQWLKVKNELAEQQLRDVFSDEFSARMLTQTVSTAPLGQRLLQTHMLGLIYLQPNANGLLQVGWRSTVADLQNWTNAHFAGWLNQLPLKQKQSTWIRLDSPSGQPVFGLLSTVEFRVAGQMQTARVLGLYPSSYFSGVHQVVADNDGEFFIADSHGYALAFQEIQYVGANLKERSSFKEMNRGASTNGSFQFKTRGKKYSAFYEKLPFGQLSLLVGFPTAPARAATGSFFGLVALCTLGALVMLWFMLNRIFSRLGIATASSVPVSSFNSKIETARSALETTKVPVTAPSQERYVTGLTKALQGPLLAILGRTQLLRNTSLQSENKEHVATIEREARRLRDVLDTLGAPFKIKGEKAKTDLIDIVNRALAAKKNDISNARVAVQKNLNASAMVQVNDAAVQQALEEVIGNAVQAMDDRSIRTLRIYDEQSAGEVVLKIEDTGRGIPQERLIKLFEPLGQFEATHKMGLGLPLAKESIEKSGGRITVESRDGEWTSVRIRFPLVLAASTVPTMPEDALTEIPLTPVLPVHAEEEIVPVPEHVVPDLAIRESLSDFEVKIRPPRARAEH